MENSIQLESDPVFVVKMPDGSEHKINPVGVILSLTKSGILDESGNPKGDTLDMLASFRSVVGIESLSDTQTMQLFDGFFEYVSELQKKIPWMRKYLPAMDSSPPPPTA